MLGKSFSRRHFEKIFIFFLEIGFDLSCKLSPYESICPFCVKCQTSFSRKNMNNIICLLSAEFVKSMVSVNPCHAE